MKLSQLKSIVKEAVKEAIQEEMKDILLEAVRSPKQTIYETSGTPQTSVDAPGPMNPVAQSPLPTSDKMKLRENMMNVLDGMRPGANGTLSATTQDIPLQLGGGDTTSANGSLPGGNVSMDQIMGLMKGKA
jgi:hypothetical protein|tara:strand:- start:6140 stop:6532 length:393 start_codon:yes stop_codon:yes gene_type:complete